MYFFFIWFYCWKHWECLLQKDAWCCFSFPPAGYLHRWSLFIPPHTEDDWQLLQTLKCKNFPPPWEKKKFGVNSVVLLFFFSTVRSLLTRRMKNFFFVSHPLNNQESRVNVSLVWHGVGLPCFYGDTKNCACCGVWCDLCSDAMK